MICNRPSSGWIYLCMLVARLGVCREEYYWFRFFGVFGTLCWLFRACRRLLILYLIAVNSITLWFLAIPSCYLTFEGPWLMSFVVLMLLELPNITINLNNFQLIDWVIQSWTQRQFTFRRNFWSLWSQPQEDLL
jgi:hypothetical protein